MKRLDVLLGKTMNTSEMQTMELRILVSELAIHLRHTVRVMDDAMEAVASLAIDAAKRHDKRVAELMAANRVEVDRRRVAEGAFEVNIVLDSLPGPDGGRFVEIEDADGHSISIGEWALRPGGDAVLTVPGRKEPHPRILQRIQKALDSPRDASWIIERIKEAMA